MLKYLKEVFHIIYIILNLQSRTKHVVFTARRPLINIHNL